MRRLVLLLALTVIYAQNSLAQNGLVVEYLFDDAPGNLVMDSGGYGYHVLREDTIDYLAPSQANQGYRKQGMRFDGVGSLLYLGDLDALDMQQYTISAWVNYNNAKPPGHFEPGRAELLPSRNHEIIEKIGGYWLNIRLDTGVLRSGGRFGGLASGCPDPISGTIVSVDSKKPVPANRWTHVATTYNGKYLKVFINGRLQGSTRAPSGMCNSPYPATIGAQYSDIPFTGYPNGKVKNHFYGTMDEFRIYDYAVSKRQIRKLAGRR